MNKIILIGNLTRDPELRTTPNGYTVCDFTIAVNNRSGRRQQDKDSHDAQYGLHAGLRWSGLRERKDSRMRTAACWSSTALQRRPVRPTSRSSRSAASELSSSDMK